jgi:hypothetical protein
MRSKSTRQHEGVPPEMASTWGLKVEPEPGSDRSRHGGARSQTGGETVFGPQHPVRRGRNQSFATWSSGCRRIRRTKPPLSSLLLANSRVRMGEHFWGYIWAPDTGIDESMLCHNAGIVEIAAVDHERAQQ